MQSNILQTLNAFWKKKKLFFANLIHTGDINEDIKLLHNFLDEINKKHTSIKININTDIYNINKDEEKNKITIEQIRSLKKWYYNKSFHTPYRFVIILNAHEMNLNASNACLKLLEDVVPNTYFFLLTQYPYFLPKTIKSRCNFIRSLTLTQKKDSKYYLDFLDTILTLEINHVQKFFTCKYNLQNISLYFTQFFNNILRLKMNLPYQLGGKGDYIKQKLKNTLLNEIINKWQYIYSIVKNNISFDIKHINCIIITEIKSLLREK